MVEGIEVSSIEELPAAAGQLSVPYVRMLQKPSMEDPAQLRQLTVDELPAACNKLRGSLIECVSLSGGHFAAGLGVVELTIALHYVFNTPDDPLIWDVGHQCYPHKILTGRKHQMHSIRTLDGLSGFPVREESEYDSFGVAHAGTSVSAGLGMASALSNSKTDRCVVSVIGDGALTEGMAFEALNHAGASKLNMVLVINDNGMSISPNVGALSAKSKRAANPVKKFIQSLSCDYTGPIDGHDVKTLVNQLKKLKSRKGIQVLHIHTQKGKGYAPAENDAVKYHAVGKFTPAKGVVAGSVPKKPTYTDVFSQWIVDAAEAEPRLDAITPAMREGSGLVAFEQKYPARYFDVGIAEQHAVTFAAGLACHNRKPVVAIYSSFMQRAYDQVVHDVALQNLDVLFAIDRAGVVGADGATHHGHFDLSYLRCIPNLIIMAPSSELECRQMLQTGLEYNGPAAVRYERGVGPGTKTRDDLSTLEIGSAKNIRTGKKTALLCFGSTLEAGAQVAEKLDATLINMRFIKPLDDRVLKELAQDHQYFVTVENNVVAGGAGSAVSESVNFQGLRARVLNLGLPDRFMSHGTQQELLQQAELDAEGIYRSILAWLKKL